MGKWASVVQKVLVAGSSNIEFGCFHPFRRRGQQDTAGVEGPFNGVEIRCLVWKSERVGGANKMASFCRVFAVPGASGPMKRLQKIFFSPLQSLNCADGLVAPSNCFDC